MDDLEQGERLEPERETRFAVIDRMRMALSDVSNEEIEQEFARVVAEVRAEMAAED